MRGDPFQLFIRLLARTLGRTKRELLATMTSREISEEIAFHRIVPLPESWEETGLLASLLYNPWRGSGPARGPADFIPSVKRPVEQSAAEGKARMGMIAAAMKAQQE